MVSCAGFFTGRRLNVANDSIDTIKFAQTWILRYLEQGNSLSEVETKRMSRSLRIALALHRGGIPDPEMPWAVKNPRLMLVLPFLWQEFPQLRFIHLVRDGRDMAFSRNQFQLKDFGNSVLDPRLSDAPLPVRSISFWSRTNLDVRSFAKAHLGENYFCIRFEDLCRRPRSVTENLFRFLGRSDQGLEDALATVRIPATLGRWRSKPTDLLEAVSEEGRDGLRELGYLVESP
jgi:hypothetical protein